MTQLFNFIVAENIAQGRCNFEITYSLEQYVFLTDLNGFKLK